MVGDGMRSDEPSLMDSLVSYDDAAADVARRLQARLDYALDRLRSDRNADPDLHATARQMRRDTESLLLLFGADPGSLPGAPRRVADVLDDVGAATGTRIDVRPAPTAVIEPAASLELLHVLAEVVEQVAAAHPGARLEVAARLDAVDALVVEVAVDDRRSDPRGPAGLRLVVAEHLARRSRSGLELRHEARVSGPLITLRCPSAVVVVEEPAWSSALLGPLVDPYHAPHYGNGVGNGAGNGGGNGYTIPPSALLGPSPGPTLKPSASSQVDELFGPLVDLPLPPSHDQSSTPIFEAIASAWFREDTVDPRPSARPDPLDPSSTMDPSAFGTGRGPLDSGPLDWDTPNDDEWRAAAARAARPDPLPSTASGLPRRRPGDQLVPPSRRRGEQRKPDEPPAERVPDRVRDRLSTYQRGLRQGRHRAPGPDNPDAAAW